MASSWPGHKPRGLPPLSGDCRDERTGKELATDGRETRGIWNVPKGPCSEAVRAKQFLLRARVIYKENGDQVLPRGDWWALAAASWP